MDIGIEAKALGLPTSPLRFVEDRGLIALPARRVFHGIVLAVLLTILAPTVSAEAPVAESLDKRTATCVQIEEFDPARALKLAESLLVETTALTPLQHANALSCRGVAYMWLGERNKARDDADALLARVKAFKSVPDRVSLTRRAGVILQRIGDREAAVDVYSKAMADSEAPGLEAVRIPLLMDLARLHMDLNDPKRAQQRLGEALKLIEQSGEKRLLPKVRLIMGLNLATEGRMAEATVLWEQVQALYVAYGRNPPVEEVPNMITLATVFQYSGQPARANAVIEQLRGMRVPISHPSLLFNLDLIEISQLQQKGQLDAAVARLDKYDVDSMLYLQQVQLLMRRVALLPPLGRYKQAFEASQQLLKIQLDYLNNQNHERLAALEARLRDRDQRLEMQRMKSEAEQQQVAMQRSSKRLWQAIGGGALLLLAAASVLFWQRRMNQRLERVSRSDALTGLSNRRDMSQKLRQLATVHGATGAVLLIDIDLFKRINDELGHDTGDAVLVSVARRLEAAVGGEGSVARWGGEEFLVFLPGADEEATRRLSERLRQVQTEPVVVGERRVSATISIGYCNLPIAGTQGPEAWSYSLQLADASLYLAKDAGRDAWVGVWLTSTLPDWPPGRLVSEFRNAYAAGVLTVESSRPL